VPEGGAELPPGKGGTGKWLRRRSALALCLVRPFSSTGRTGHIPGAGHADDPSGYDEYFLTVWDLLQDVKAAGIDWICRGSAADSLTIYCLGISNFCPVRFEMYFKRFLNLERMKLNKLPDIDLDFPWDRRDDVVEMLFKKYGKEHAAIVGGFSTFQARSALAEVAKVLGVSDRDIRRVTEHLPHTGAGEIAEALQHGIESRDAVFHEEPYASAIRLARILDG